MLEYFGEIVLLTSLGGLGWLIFSLLRVPVPGLFGAMVVVGTLRVLGYPLPQSPGFLSFLIQTMLGLYVGSKVTRHTVKELYLMFRPATVIVVWTLSVIFILGFYLSRFTFLDPKTAVLSSSMGGLPELTVIALATDADVAVIIVIQTFRMISTVISFPFIFRVFIEKHRQENPAVNPATVSVSCKAARSPRGDCSRVWGNLKRLLSLEAFRSGKDHVKEALPGIRPRVKDTLISIGLAVAGGWLFESLRVPAGGMVGAMFFVAFLSLFSRIKIYSPSPGVFGLMMIGVGLMIADNLNHETLGVLTDGSILMPLLISTLILYLSSLAVAYIIHRLMGWDFPASFLAAAPAGFTVMTALAIKYDRDPFKVSILHLCRLLTIKAVVPFLFMVFY